MEDAPVPDSNTALEQPTSTATDTPSSANKGQQPPSTGGGGGGKKKKKGKR
jgi:hypothetical protein